MAVFCHCFVVVVVMLTMFCVFSACCGFYLVVATARVPVVFLNLLRLRVVSVVLLRRCEVLRRVAQHTCYAKARVPRRCVFRVCGRAYGRVYGRSLRVRQCVFRLPLSLSILQLEPLVVFQVVVAM